MSSAPTYQHVDPDGTFTFHGPDGEQHQVTGRESFAALEQWQQRFLDECPFVKRAVPAKPAKAEEA